MIGVLLRDPLREFDAVKVMTDDRSLKPVPIWAGNDNLTNCNLIDYWCLHCSEFLLKCGELG